MRVLDETVETPRETGVFDLMRAIGSEFIALIYVPR